MSTMLKGITWNHSRGFSSIVAVTQRFSELHPGFDIVWEKRSLSEFESKPIEQLAQEYDLLVIDHPWAGFAARHHVLLPLQTVLPADFLADQAAHSVGQSHNSYNFDGFQSALAIDAASPIAVHRPDKMSIEELPRTFDAVLELADGKTVIYAATPTYLLMDFYAFCNTAGGRLFDLDDPEHVVDLETGCSVLEDMRALAMRCPKTIFDYDTITLHEALCTSDTAAYCPFVYGYVNYSRRGYAAHPVKVSNIVSYRGRMLTGVLGGTGLAISSGCSHVNEAAAFVKYALDPVIQRTVYFDAGGQPGYRDAWTDEDCNRLSLDFFRDTLPTLDASYLRPRYSGYLRFQDNAGPVIRDYVQDGGDPVQTIEHLNRLYRASLEQ